MKNIKKFLVLGSECTKRPLGLWVVHNNHCLLSLKISQKNVKIYSVVYIKFVLKNYILSY